MGSSSSRHEMLPRLTRLCLKELREILRDRRTIITLVLMPILIYPLLSVAFQKFILSSNRDTAKLEYIIGVESTSDYKVLIDHIAIGEHFLNEKEKGDRQPKNQPGDPKDIVKMFGLDQTGSAAEPSIRYVKPEYWAEGGEEPSSLEDAVADNVVHLGVRVVSTATGDAVSRVQLIRFEIIQCQGWTQSGEARRYVTRRLNAVNQEYYFRFATRRLKLEFGSTDAPIVALQKTVRNSGSNSVSLATIIPLILIMMTVTGAVYPAIDLTAGERERGTLETLIAAPVPRLGLLLAKYVAVLAVALLTAGVNITAMTVTMFSIGLETLLFGERGLTLVIAIQILLLLFLFAGFFSAVLLVVTSFARSFKEAQAYLIPLMLVSLAPGVLSLTPGLEMNFGLAITPLVNIVLLARDVVDDSVQLLPAILAVLSTIAYAVGALSLAARIFGTDAILYGSQSSWTDLITRPLTPRDVAPMPNAGTCLLVLFPSFILLGSISGHLSEISLSTRLLINSLLTALLFCALPLLFARFGRVQFFSGFRLHPAKVLAFVGALLLGSSLWPFVYEIELFTIDTDQLEKLKELVSGVTEQMKLVPLSIKLITLALVPAVCEEFFFRGYLFGSLRKVTSPLNTIVLSALLFGLFHVIVRDSLFLERLLPTTLMGLVLGWVCYRTGSVIPGTILHLAHNGLIMCLVHYQTELEKYDIQDQNHLPLKLLLIAASLAVAGFVAVFFSKPVNAIPTR